MTGVQTCALPISYERHVIHTALQETPDITTYSIGTEPNRRTVVAYSRGEHR